MRVSLNQLRAAAQRALEGAGFPYGADDEGAELVAELECIGLGGARRLLARLPALARDGYPQCLQPPDAPAGCFDGSLPAGGLALAMPVADWCRWQSERHGGVGRARIDGGRCGVDHGEGAWYLAAALTLPAGWWSEVRWTENGRGLCGRRDGHGEVSLLRRTEGKPADAKTSGGGIEMLAAAGPLPPPSGYAPWRNADECRQRRHRCLHEGVRMDADTWRALKAHADKVLVPASPDSTERGAGEGAGALHEAGNLSDS